LAGDRRSHADRKNIDILGQQAGRGVGGHLDRAIHCVAGQRLAAKRRGSATIEDTAFGTTAAGGDKRFARAAGLRVRKILWNILEIRRGPTAACWRGTVIARSAAGGGIKEHERGALVQSQRY